MAGDGFAIECIGRLQHSFHFCMVQTMTFSLQIALLEPDALTRAQLALALVRAKHEVIECADVSSLYEALDAHDKCAQAQPGFARVLYVRRAAYSAAMLDGLLPHLRSLYGVVVVLGLEADMLCEPTAAMGGDMCIDAARAADVLATLDLAPQCIALSSGAGYSAETAANAREISDSASAATAQKPTCIDYDMPVQETVPTGFAEADSQSALRGDYANPEEAYGTWKIAHKGWVIINPRGEHIPLTGVERNFFEVLLGSERHEISRETIEADQCGFALDSMSVLVSRLRKKVGASGCPLPLHTVHGLGYVFIGGLVRLRHAPFAPSRAPGPAAA